MVAPATERARGKLGYTPSIDALRAISVTGVILYHGGFSWMPGGFLGVEVFFVVSGFLITTLLVEERHLSGAISLRNFWYRRGRRLLPALYVLLLVVPAVVLLFFRDAAARLGGDVVAALFYVSNWWQIYLDESYFDQAGRPPVLRHLWSLAVEEQFYIIFPIFFVWLLRSQGRARSRNVLLGLAAASALWMAYLYVPYEDPSRVYYGTDTRMSGLLLGAVLALVWSPWRTGGNASKSAGRLLDGSGVVALVVIGWFFLRVNEFDPFIYWGGFVLIDLACVVLIAVLVHPSSKLARLMGAPPLVWIGVRSYSIYLWHWPIFVMTRPDLDVPLRGWPLFAFRITLTMIAAELSFRFIEIPVRNGAVGAYFARLQASRDDERVRRQRNFLLGTVGFASVLLLIAGGLIASAGDSDTSEFEVAAGVTTTVVASDTTTTTAPDLLAPPAPGTYPTDAVAVGDSVMLGARGTLQEVMPGVRVDAEISRQFIDVVNATEWFATSGNMPGPAIVQLGNNGVTVEDRMEDMVEVLGDRRIVFVNAKVPKQWESIANARTAAVAERHDNVALADWNALAEDHPEYLVPDGTHLTEAGQEAYAQLIGSKL